jgi:iron(III) transport system substrate-binding protein
MRPRMSFILHALAAAAASIVLPGQSAAAQSTAQAAAKEGQVVWYASPGTAAQMASALDAWSKLHPGIKINIVEAPGPDGMERIRTEQRSHHPVADLFSQGDIGTWQAVQGGLYQTFDPTNVPNEQKLSPRVKPFLDPGRHVVPVYLMAYGITVNRQSVPEADWPQGWKDLLKPNLANTLGLHSFGVIGGGLSWYMVGRQALGDDFFKALVAAKPRVYSRAPEEESAVETGARGVIAPAPLQSYTQSNAKNAPVKFIVPREGLYFVTMYNGVVRDAPHPAAAQMFLNFLLTPPAQAALARAGDVPVIDTSISPIDLSRVKFLGRGATTRAQGERLPDYIKAGQILMGQ